MWAWLASHPAALVVFMLMVAVSMPVLAHFRPLLCVYTACFAVGLALAGSLHLALLTLRGEVLSYAVEGWSPPWGIEVVVTPLSAFMLVVITAVSLCILVYSIASLEQEIPPGSIGWYYTSFLLLLAAMMGLAMANDLFNIYVFIEVSTIAACALVVAKNSKAAAEAALRYLLLAIVGSGFILFAICLLYLITGHLNITFTARALAGVYQQYPFLTWTALSFFLVGFSIKAALFPLHVWLPDAHSSAPAPSSAVLSALTIKIYAVVLIKLFFPLFGLQMLNETYLRHILLLMASLAIVAGSLFAFVQLDLKRRLAYSSVSGIGYIFLGIGLGSQLGLAAGILHIFNHAIMKACLFLSAGAIYRQTELRQVNRLQGIAFSMPVTMAAFSIAALSMVGIPLTSGFISKWYLSQGSIAAGQPIFIGLIVLSGILNASYFLPIIWQAFFVVDRQQPKTITLDAIPFSMLAGQVILAVAVLFFGFWPGFPLSLAQKAAAVILP
ncbi:MAG: Na(+)/H(+) antiporter subunit D [Syntrophomonadaceae bacterium]|nr:Na(+)/H(+) antiporter subunit D [Bacillota bacterium]